MRPRLWAGHFVEPLERRQLLSIVTPSHVVVVIAEDRAAGAIGDVTNMPYLNQLAGTGLVYSNSHGLNTPAQQGEMAYLALFFGSTQGVTDDNFHGPFSGGNLAASLNNAGKTFVGYSEAMPRNGDTTDQLAADPKNPAYDDLYTRSYNPMAQFSNVGTGITSASVNQTFAGFPTTAAGYAALPTVSFVIPDTRDNTHGSNDTAPFATDPSSYNLLRQNADSWLKNNLDGYLQWAKQNNSLLIITGDEGDRAHGFASLATNDVTTIVNGDPRLFVAGTDKTSINPYNILRTIEDMYGLTPLGSSATASDLDANAAGQLAPPGSASATNTTVVASIDPSTVGQSVTFTATVTGTGTPTGTVTFLDGSTTLGTASLSASGAATFSDSSLAVGSHSITGSYSGDARNLASVSSALSQTVTAPVATASFVRTDGVTQGSWSGTYGSDGYDLFNDAISLPAYAQVAPGSGTSAWTWATQSSDPRAAQDSATSSTRTAACLFGGTSFSLDLNLTDGQSHQVALYLLDWDARSRAESVQVSDAASGAILDTHQASNFSQGQWLVWNLSGHVTITLTLTGGLNPVAGALLFDPVASTAKPTATASYVGADGTTQGNWSGVYGSDGYSVVGGSTSLPSYVALTAGGVAQYTWAAPTPDVRAPQASAGSSSRVAACDYSNSPSFSLDLNLTDGKTHQVSLYLLDWDARGRAETIQMTDAGTGALLDSRSIANFSSGQWLTWDLSGHVKINVINAGSLNEVLSGVFFDQLPATSVPAAASFIKSDAVTGGTWTGTYGADGYDEFDGPVALPSYARVAVTGASQYVWAAGTNDPRALQTSAAATTRTAACDFASSSFTLDVNLMDGQSHRVALYLLDFDHQGRSQSVQVTDAASGVGLDTQSVANFAGGEYLDWTITGHVKITIINAGGWLNAVASGLFFG